MRRQPDPRRPQRIRDEKRRLNCSVKVHYSTWEAARNMLIDMTHGQGGALKIYRCPICGQFCLGNDKRKKRGK
jgi:hypothetical protein